MCWIHEPYLGVCFGFSRVDKVGILRLGLLISRLSAIGVFMGVTLACREATLIRYRLAESDGATRISSFLVGIMLE